MYHHFRSKAEIVQAIYVEESRSTIERAFKSVDAETTPIAKLKAACLAWTEEVRVPSVSKILFEIGPSALGPEKAKEIEDSYSLRLIEQQLEQAIEAGELKPVDPKLIAAFLNSLVAESALYTLRTGKDSMEALRTTIDAMFDSLQP